MLVVFSAIISVFLLLMWRPTWQKCLGVASSLECAFVCVIVRLDHQRNPGDPSDASI